MTTGYHAWSAFSFDMVAHLTRLGDEELGRQLARAIGRNRPFSRQAVAAWRAGTDSPRLNVFLAAVEMAGVDLPYAAQLAPNRPFAEDRVTQLPKAVGAEHRVQLRVIPGVLALVSLLAFAFIALSTHSSSPQVWARAAQQVVQQIPAQVNSEAGPKSSSTDVSVRGRQVAQVTEDETKEPAAAKPSPSPSPTTGHTTTTVPSPTPQTASTVVGVSAEAQWSAREARARTAVKAAIAAKTAPKPTPVPTAAATDAITSSSTASTTVSAPVSASAASSTSTPTKGP